MSNRNRFTDAALGVIVGVGIALLFLVWAFPGFRNPAYQQERYQNAKNGETGEYNPVVRPSLWETYTSPTDTYAQWIAAFAAFGSVGVSIWAVRLVRDTLELNRKSTDAAWAAVRHAEKASSLELRAYLAIVPKGVNQLIGTRDVMGHIEVRNVGRLPARKVFIHVRMGLFNERVRDLAKLPVADDLTDSKLAFVDRVVQPGDNPAQGSEDREPLNFISPDEWEFVYVWGVVYYFDGFDERRFTRFCHRYAIDSRNREFDEEPASAPAPTETRQILFAEKARYHQIGNDAN
ncbi:hypothetical protein [Mesorhizobium sp. M0496]|uniref:hypothetical protein n=1 Tax=Mesorhizobium sp. M0496 TaxID=2956952 RepID=UPI00333DDC48